MLIGALSAATGVSRRALRYYEEEGLIRSRRLDNGYRDYGPEAADVVLLVQDLFSVGLSSRLLREIVPCMASGAPGAPPDDLLRRVVEVRDRLILQEQQIQERRQALDAYLADAKLRPALPSSLAVE